MNKIIFAGIIAVAFTGCGGGGGGGDSQNQSPLTDAEKISDLENTGVIPKLDRSASLIGPDVNVNGIRDDIEEYIDAKYASDEERSAARQSAKSFQGALSVDTTNNAEVKAASNKIANALNCIFTKFNWESADNNPLRVSAELEAISFNTKDRLNKYEQYNKALDGSSSSIPDGDTCE